MRRIYDHVIEWGIREDTPPEKAQNFRLTNGIFFFLLLGSIVVTSSYVVAGVYTAALLNSLALFVFGGALLLMRAGHVVAARMLAFVVSYIAGYALSVTLGPETLIQLLFLFGSAISITFFTLNEKRLLALYILMPIVLLGLLEYTHYEPILGLTRQPLTDGQVHGLRVVSLATMWLMMLGHFAFFIRDRRMAQEQLISNAKMVAMGRMASGIAHEVNNPLQSIVGQAESLKSLAARGTLSHSEATSLAEKIQSVAMRIAAIVRGLKALSRDASGDPFAPIQLRSLVELTLDQCHAQLRSKNINVIVDEIPDSWTVTGREAQLSEVLLNVISNAHDAIMDLGEKWIHIDANIKGEFIDVSITDSGSGVSSKIRPKLFDPFFTTKPVGKGTGLGLSVSRGIMIAHGGQILYDEKSPRTRFIIRIPRHSGADTKPTETC